MAQISFAHLAINQTAAISETTGQVLLRQGVTGKPGKIMVSLFNEIDRDLHGKPKAGVPAFVQLFETDDNVILTELSALPSEIKPGGQNTVVVFTNKQFLIVKGRVDSGSALVKIDLVYNGLPYFGGLDLGLIGKSGFGKDQDAATADNGVANAAPGVWPEA